MITYYNLSTGREVVRPHGPDPWLDASAGWTRLWQPPVAESDNEPSIDGDEKGSI